MTLLLFRRSYSYLKFKRVYTPPLPQPKESPYIVGPYLKPDYLPTEYLTEPIKSRHDDHLNYFIYEPTEVTVDEDRTVKLLLIDDVEGLGIKGQVVEAPYRYGASRLIALKKAEYATPFAFEWYKFGPRTSESASSALSPRTARLLKSQVFRLPISKEVITEPWHICFALRQAGCICPSQAIESISESYPRVKCVVIINDHERVEVEFAKI